MNITLSDLLIRVVLLCGLGVLAGYFLGFVLF